MVGLRMLLCRDFASRLSYYLLGLLWQLVVRRLGAECSRGLGRGLGHPSGVSGARMVALGRLSELAWWGLNLGGFLLSCLLRLLLLFVVFGFLVR